MRCGLLSTPTARIPFFSAAQRRSSCECPPSWSGTPGAVSPRGRQEGGNFRSNRRHDLSGRRRKFEACGAVALRAFSRGANRFAKFPNLWLDSKPIGKTRVAQWNRKFSLPLEDHGASNEGSGRGMLHECRRAFEEG